MRTGSSTLLRRSRTGLERARARSGVASDLSSFQGGHVLLRVLVLLAFLAGIATATWKRWIVPESVQATVRDYLATRRIDHHLDALLDAGEEFGVDPNLLAAICLVESSGKIAARSSKNALGLFQLSMVTAVWRAELLGLPPPTEEELLSDARLNARLGASNVAWLLDTYDGDVRRALVAYNTGTRRLKNLCDAAGGWEAWVAERERAGDSNLLAYAERVLRARERFEEQGLFENLERADEHRDDTARDEG